VLICGYGSDEEVEVVAKHCQESQVATNIHLLSQRFDITYLMAQAKVLLFTSQAYESFGYVVVEAMCCRVPVVVTDVGGLPEVVEDGVCGYVAERHDMVSFASHIEELLCYETLRKKMGEQGKLSYEQYFSAKRMASEYAELVRD
jgi:glycosyltransferase involved in cell wall biosynthesis